MLELKTFVLILLLFRRSKTQDQDFACDLFEGNQKQIDIEKNQAVTIKCINGCIHIVKVIFKKSLLFA